MVPPGTFEGSKLRLKGQGKLMENYRKGDFKIPNRYLVGFILERKILFMIGG